VLDLFLSAADSIRASRTLQMLSGHNIAEWVLVGGLAIELHLIARGLTADPRPLNDISVGMLRLISIEDLTTRNARLNLDLAEGKPVPAKHSRDLPCIYPPNLRPHLPDGIGL
jgi:hypothetical protein